MFYKKGVLKNFAIFTGKHLCQSHFFNKVAVLLLEKCNHGRMNGKVILGYYSKQALVKRKWEKEHLYSKYCVVSRNNRLNFEQLA